MRLKVAIAIGVLVPLLVLASYIGLHWERYQYIGSTAPEGTLARGHGLLILDGYVVLPPYEFSFAEKRLRVNGIIVGPEQWLDERDLPTTTEGVVQLACEVYHEACRMSPQVPRAQHIEEFILALEQIPQISFVRTEKGVRVRYEDTQHELNYVLFPMGAPAPPNPGKRLFLFSNTWLYDQERLEYARDELAEALQRGALVCVSDGFAVSFGVEHAAPTFRQAKTILSKPVSEVWRFHELKSLGMSWMHARDVLNSRLALRDPEQKPE